MSYDGMSTSPSTGAEAKIPLWTLAARIVAAALLAALFGCVSRIVHDPVAEVRVVDPLEDASVTDSDSRMGLFIHELHWIVQEGSGRESEELPPMAEKDKETPAGAEATETSTLADRQ